jgi:hypothetical protein
VLLPVATILRGILSQIVGPDYRAVERRVVAQLLKEVPIAVLETCIEETS